MLSLVPSRRWRIAYEGRWSRILLLDIDLTQILKCGSFRRPHCERSQRNQSPRRGQQEWASCRGGNCHRARLSLPQAWRAIEAKPWRGKRQSARLYLCSQDAPAQGIWLPVRRKLPHRQEARRSRKRYQGWKAQDRAPHLLDLEVLLRDTCKYSKSSSISFHKEAVTWATVQKCTFLRLCFHQTPRMRHACLRSWHQDIQGLLWFGVLFRGGQSTQGCTLAVLLLVITC